MLLRLLSLVLTALSFGFAVDAHAAGHHHRRHHELARRASSDIQLHKRLNDARWTFYDVGLGACGKWSQPGDFMVALNADQFGTGYPGPNCFKTITMTYGGLTAIATILDRCVSCPHGGLDLSPSLFEFFAPQSEGVIYGTWFFNDGSGGGGGFDGHSPTHTPAWTPLPTPSWTPPAIWSSSTTAKPKPTITWKPTSTSSSSSSSITSSTKPFAYSTSSAASGPPVPTGSVAKNVTGPQNVDRLSTLFISLGRFIVSSRSTT